MAISVKVDAKLAEQLGLRQDEYQRIKKLLKREPNFTELNVFSAMWSEHCSYKNSRKLFGLFPKKTKAVIVPAGQENCGVVDIGDGLGVAFKIESHNHPSAIEPFEASATGLGGCLRDIFTMGARPIAAAGSLRFGKLDAPRVKLLFKEVIRGFAHYANTAAVNVVGGEAYFDESYEGNPLVNAFVVGIVKKKNITRGDAYGVGNAVYYIGGSTGRDGVGGASFASQEITDESAACKSAVAVGDPELGKRLRDACLELIDKGLVVGMQDMGAAGLTCSTSETASRSSTGIEIDVALVPQREKGMLPYEILLSESQERMLAIFNDASEVAAMRILKRYNLNARKIGKVTNDCLLRVKDNGVVVCEIPVDALTKKAPLYERRIKKPQYLKEANELKRRSLKEPDDYNKVLLQLLDSPTIASKEWSFKKFIAQDKEDILVGAGSDAAVIRIKGTKKALAISVDCNGRYCYLNPYYGAMIAVAEAARNVVCAGARPLAITDGLNFGNPLKPENYWQFKKCIEGISAACAALNTPVISGNVSFYNENPKGAVDPTPIIGMVGLIEDARNYVTQHFKNKADLIVLLGENSADLSGSEYLYLLHRQKKGNPKIDIHAEKALQQACRKAIAAGIINSAHDCSEGGLAITLAESCISSAESMLGAEIDLDRLKSRGIRLDELLFGEAPSRIVVSLNPKNLALLEKISAQHRVACCLLGEAGNKKLLIRYQKKPLIELSLEVLSSSYRRAIPSRLE